MQNKYEKSCLQKNFSGHKPGARQLILFCEHTLHIFLLVSFLVETSGIFVGWWETTGFQIWILPLFATAFLNQPAGNHTMTLLMRGIISMQIISIQTH